MRDLTDTVAGFTIPQAVLDKHANETHTLNCMWSGLELLNRQTAIAEDVVRSRLPADMIWGGFNLPEFEGISQPNVVSFFHWYANSACNMARLLGWFRKQVDPTADDPPLYMQAVLPTVYPFRDKVSAHFARTTGPKRDNEAERDASVISALGWDNGVFVMPWGTIAKRSSGKSSDSSVIQSWSITRIHTGLRERFGFSSRPAGEAMPTRADVEVRLLRALTRLKEQDGSLLTDDVNERSMTHRLAAYLQTEFPDWHVDAEYNRNHGKAKAFRPEVLDRPSTDTDAVTVYPDIIVHRRGTSENLLVIEAKKRGGRATGYDEQKLHAYTLPESEGGLAYKWGVQLVLSPSSTPAEMIQAWYVNGQRE